MRIDSAHLTVARLVAQSRGFGGAGRGRARMARPNVHNRTFDKQTGIWIGGDYDVKVNLTFSVQVSGCNLQRSAPPNALFPRSGETMAPDKYNPGTRLIVECQRDFEYCEMIRFLVTDQGFHMLAPKRCETIREFTIYP